MDNDARYPIPADYAGMTVAAVLRLLKPPMSWSAARQLISARQVLLNGALCLDDARRVNAGEVLTLCGAPRPTVPREADVDIIHVDPDLIVVNKPPGIQTLRRPEEAHWDEQRKQRQPTLDELLNRMLPRLAALRRPPSAPPRRGTPRPPRPARPKLFDVHRLDRDTSGLMLFALSPRARDLLVGMFARHDIQRTYLAVALGRVEPQRIESWIVRDRGDGLRGSTPSGAEDPQAQQAITHIQPVEYLGHACTVVRCRLETGRTHQIRIHLAEAGHMICGEKTYTRPRPGADPAPDPTNAPRHALHSAELQFTHPITGHSMIFKSPLPPDLAHWLDQLRHARPPGPRHKDDR